LAQKPIDNAAIVQMTKAGLGDSLIIESINATPTSFATSPGDLIALKQAGVSERVISAMVSKTGSQNTVSTPGTPPTRTALLDETAAAAAAPPPDLTGVDELGIYYKAHEGKWTKIEPELVNFRSGGALKSYATDHLIKEDRNGHLMGESSHLALDKQTIFLLYMPAGVDPVEYLLLKLRPGAQHSREFRSETGGMFHSSTGAMRDEIAFNATKVAPHIYQFTLPANAQKGEYGILPPGAVSSANAGSSGKIYTFKILE
jgi:hypothetical protein